MSPTSSPSALSTVLLDHVDLLTRVSEYLEKHIDVVDGADGTPRPNRAAALHADVEAALTVFEEHSDFIAEEAWANARLIAAAPRLKTALMELERAIAGYVRGEDFYTRDNGLALILARKVALNALEDAETQS